MQRLSSKQPFITNPSPSTGLKKIGRLYLFKFPGQFHIFRDARTENKKMGLPGQPRMYGSIKVMNVTKELTFFGTLIKFIGGDNV